MSPQLQSVENQVSHPCPCLSPGLAPTRSCSVGCGQASETFSVAVRWSPGRVCLEAALPGWVRRACPACTGPSLLHSHSHRVGSAGDCAGWTQALWARGPQLLRKVWLKVLAALRASEWSGRGHHRWMGSWGPTEPSWDDRRLSHLYRWGIDGTGMPGQLPELWLGACPGAGPTFILSHDRALVTNSGAHAISCSPEPMRLSIVCLSWRLWPWLRMSLPYLDSILALH